MRELGKQFSERRHKIFRGSSGHSAKKVDHEIVDKMNFYTIFFRNKVEPFQKPQMLF